MRAFRFYVRFFSPDPNYMSEECRCCLEPIRPVVTRLHRELCEFFPWHPATEAQRLWLREQSWHHSHSLDFRHDSYPKHLFETFNRASMACASNSNVAPLYRHLSRSRSMSISIGTPSPQCFVQGHSKGILRPVVAFCLSRTFFQISRG